MFAMHAVLVSPVDVNQPNKPVSIGTEHIPVDIMLFECMGGICGASRELIQQKMKLLMEAGNSNVGKRANDGTEGNVFLDSISHRVAVLIHADEDNMRHDLQVEAFALAGMVVILLLALAIFVSLLSIAINCAIIIWKLRARSDCHDPGQFKTHSTECFSKIISLMVLFASALYPVLIWNHTHQLKGGYTVMLVCSIGMRCNCIGASLPKKTSDFAFIARRLKKRGNPPSSSTVGDNAVSDTVTQNAIV